MHSIYRTGTTSSLKRDRKKKLITDFLLKEYPGIGTRLILTYLPTSPVLSDLSDPATNYLQIFLNIVTYLLILRTTKLPPDGKLPHHFQTRLSQVTSRPVVYVSHKMGQLLI